MQQDGKSADGDGAPNGQLGRVHHATDGKGDALFDAGHGSDIGTIAFAVASIISVNMIAPGDYSVDTIWPPSTTSSVPVI